MFAAVNGTEERLDVVIAELRAIAAEMRALRILLEQHVERDRIDITTHDGRRHKGRQ